MFVIYTGIFCFISLYTIMFVSTLSPHLVKSFHLNFHFVVSLSFIWFSLSRTRLKQNRTHCSLIQRFVNNFFFVLSGCACVQKQENGNHFFVCNMCPPSCDQLVHTSIDFHPKYKGLKRFYAVLLGLWRGVNCALFCFILTFGFRCRTVFRKRLNLSNVVFFFASVCACSVFEFVSLLSAVFFYIWLFYFFAIQIEDNFSFWVWFRFCLLLVQFIMV